MFGVVTRRKKERKIIKRNRERVSTQHEQFQLVSKVYKITPSHGCTMSMCAQRFRNKDMMSNFNLLKKLRRNTDIRYTTPKRAQQLRKK